jgi:hypothetical protein
MNGAVQARPGLGGRNFACPEGIKFTEIDSETGLLSTLFCPRRELIAITDVLAPNSECYQHGNIPNGLEAGQQSQTSQTDLSAKTTGRKPVTTEPSSSYYSRLRTRVDIDTRGRRTLVNEMR